MKGERLEQELLLTEPMVGSIRTVKMRATLNLSR